MNEANMNQGKTANNAPLNISSKEKTTYVVISWTIFLKLCRP